MYGFRKSIPQIPVGFTKFVKKKDLCEKLLLSNQKHCIPLCEIFAKNLEDFILFVVSENKNIPIIHYS